MCGECHACHISIIHSSREISNFFFLKYQSSMRSVLFPSWSWRRHYWSHVTSYDWWVFSSPAVYYWSAWWPLMTDECLIHMLYITGLYVSSYDWWVFSSPVVYYWSACDLWWMLSSIAVYYWSACDLMWLMYVEVHSWSLSCDWTDCSMNS